MSVAAITAAWKVDCEPTQKLVLLALADHANDETWKCWPSLGHLHKKTGLNRRTVSRALKLLADAGLIGRINRGRESTVYQLNVASWGHETPRGTEPLGAQSHKGRGDTPLGVGATCPQPRGDMPHEPSGNRKREPSGNRKGARDKSVPCPEGVSQSVWSDVLAHRRRMKAPLTETAWKRMEPELRALEAEGWSPDDVIAEWLAAGWRAFKADWIRNRGGSPAGGPKNGKGNLDDASPV